jgi:hypothetical protein
LSPISDEQFLAAIQTFSQIAALKEKPAVGGGRRKLRTRLLSRLRSRQAGTR